MPPVTKSSRPSFISKAWKFGKKAVGVASDVYGMYRGYKYGDWSRFGLGRGWSTFSDYFAPEYHPNRSDAPWPRRRYDFLDDEETELFCVCYKQCKF